jgi:hypothetical protein
MEMIQHAKFYTVAEAKIDQGVVRVVSNESSHYLIGTIAAYGDHDNLSENMTVYKTINYVTSPALSLRQALEAMTELVMDKTDWEA